jgi:hypothetical protein
MFIIDPSTQRSALARNVVVGSIILYSDLYRVAMVHISRSTFLICIALMIAVIAAACDTAADKPTAESPTAVPPVASQDVDTDTTLSLIDAFTDSEVRQCLSEQLGDRFDDDLGAVGPELLSRFGPRELAVLESCGVDIPGALGGNVGAASLDDPEVQECLAGQLGMDLSAGEFDLTVLRELEPTDIAAAFEACGAEFGRPGAGGGILGDGGGLFGGGQRGAGRGGFAGGAGGDILECLTEELGEDPLALLRDPIGMPPADFQAALEKCGAGIAIPIEPNDSAGDGTGPIPIEPITEPTATSIPVSELTIEQLTCLSGELDPSDLAVAVVATSAGDISEISDELLAVLQVCGVGS